MSVSSYDLEDTIVAIASGQVENTPIGIIRLSGSDAISIAENLMKSAFDGKGFKAVPWGQMFRCEIRDRTGEYMDDGLGVVFHGPHSFTGEDVVEWHIHGSQVLLQQVVKECIFFGARQASPGEFSYRAFLNEKISLDQAEGIASRIGSQSIQEVRGTASAMKGKVSEFLMDLREDLTRFKGFLELEIDFLDQGYSGEGLKAAGKLTKVITKKMGEFITTGESWKKIRKGMQMCIIGPPNAGKSTLFNALVQEDRSIVSEKPGTTRDTVMELAEIGGVQWSLWDTAGIHESDDFIEKRGILKSQEKLRNSDAIIFLLDPFRMDESLEFFKTIHSSEDFLRKSTYRVYWGKSDLLSKDQKIHCTERAVAAGVDGVGFLSSERSEELSLFRNELQTFLSEILLSDEHVTPSSDLYVNERQLNLMKSAKNEFDSLCEKLMDSEQGPSEEGSLEESSPELLAEDMQNVLSTLDEVLGRVDADEVVEKVFQNFCIGK